MGYVKTTDKLTGEELRISYKDYGKGRPIVLIHGWPLSKEMWEYQLEPLVEAGFRCVKYDRRGFGKSSKPWDGYNYDNFADDLKAVLDHLDLQNVVLVGFSMGGGEIARYFAKHGGARVSKVVIVSSILPFLAKKEDNPDGVDQSVFDEMMKQMKDDRISFLDSFGKQFFGVNLINHPVSTPLLEYYRSLASVASGRSTTQAAIAFSQTDLRNDVDAINVPALIIHGDSDKTVPIESSSDRLQGMLSDAQYKIYEGAPHGLFYTHREKLNADIIEFARF